MKATPTLDRAILYHDDEGRLRAKAASLLAEADLNRWFSLGCPADRTYRLGWSLLDGPKSWGPLAPTDGRGKPSGATP